MEVEFFCIILFILSLSQVRVQVEDVNEPPQFPSEVLKASVFSIAPYKTPVIRVKVNTPGFTSFQTPTVIKLQSVRLHAAPLCGLINSSETLCEQ